MDRIVLFDGVCNFCNSSVNFIIRHDRKGVFKFAPLQSEIGSELTRRYRIADDVDSIILIDGEEAFVKSDAALGIARSLGGVWSLLYSFRIVPRFMRDWFYDRIAQYRYRLFGKKDVCMIPTHEVRGRFLSEPPA